MSDYKWCKTVDSKEINLFDPDPALFTVERIANSLARINRFAGHWERPVSVARHSIRVAKLLRDAGHDTEMQLQGLFHDAAEAFTTDIPSPLKRRLSIELPSGCFVKYCNFEDMLSRHIFKALEIEWPLRPEVHRFDRCLTEEECKWVRGEDDDLYYGLSLDPYVGALAFRHQAVRMLAARSREHANG